jgi:hypothetical protein
MQGESNMARPTRLLARSFLVAFSVVTLAGVALAEPAAPTHTASPTAEASRHFRVAYTEVSTGLTPAGAKRGLALATARVQRGYAQFLTVVHPPTPSR